MDKMLQMAAAGGLAVLGLLLQGAEALKAAEVPDVLKDESGQLYVEAMVREGAERGRIAAPGRGLSLLLPTARLCANMKFPLG
jgi:hypothetical protein